MLKAWVIVCLGSLASQLAGGTMLESIITAALVLFIYLIVTSLFTGE